MSDDRFSSLAGILDSPPRRDDDAPNVSPIRRTATQSPAASDTQRPSAPRSREGQQRPRPRTSPKSETAAGGVRRVAFRLEPDLHDRLSHYAATTRTSRGHVVLDAIEALHEQNKLPAIIKQANETAPSNGLFPRLKLRGEAGPSVPVDIKIDIRAARTIDQLVIDLQAESRTQLITEALRHYLPPPPSD